MPTSRLAAIDIVRGFCILSMILGHLSGDNWLSRAVHSLPQFDGASGFVLLSGLVLGIVQHRKTDRSGLMAVQRGTGKRLVTIAVAQWALVIVAVTVALALPTRHDGLPLVDLYTPSQILWNALNFTLAPPAGSVLRLYLVLLVLALGVYWLLARGRQLVVVALSFAIYCASFVTTEWTSFRASDGTTLGANWASWQFLFFAALLVGWNWARWSLADRLRRHRVRLLVVTVLVGAVIFVAGRAFPAVFEKASMAPGRLVAAFAAVLFLYLLVDYLLERLPRTVFRPLEMVGRRSLDSYIIQAIIAVSLPSVIPALTLSSPWSLPVSVAVLLVCWGWAELRELRRAGRTSEKRAVQRRETAPSASGS